MSMPLIGVTTFQERATDLPRGYIGQNATYSRAILRAGGMPVMIPTITPTTAIPEFLSRLDAVLFTGGVDINPRLYGEKMHPRVTEIDMARDDLEIPLMQTVIEWKKPFLAICRGHQVLNVALGGTLFTHIADQLPNALHHPCYPDMPRNYPAHSLELEPDSRLAKIFGDTTVQVNSLHHQGINRLAERLRPVGYAPDGLVEAVELPDYPFGIGVQWHPEALPDSVQMQALFSAFIQAASAH